MKSRRGVLIGVVLTVVIVVVVVGVASKVRTGRSNYAAEAAPAVQLARDFTSDALSKRFDAAAAKAVSRITAREIAQQIESVAASGPITAQDFMAVWRRRVSTGNVWRVDAKLTLAGGQVMYAQFLIVPAPAPQTLAIDTWGIEPWPKSGFVLGDVDPMYPDAELGPGTRDVRKSR